MYCLYIGTKLWMRGTYDECRAELNQLSTYYPYRILSINQEK